MKKVLLLGTLSLLLGACSSGPKTPAAETTPTTTQSPSPTAVSVKVPSKVTLNFAESNKSGQKGTAVLEEVDGKVKVTLVMTGTKYVSPQPAHIHIGVCPGVGAVKWPLSELVNGRSVTMLVVTMADLAAAGPLAINVHKSAAEAAVYTACTPFNW